MITKNDIPGLRKLWQQAFGDSDDLLDKFFSVGFSPERCGCIRDGEAITAALYWFDCSWKGKKTAYIYAVATDIFYRGKGLCRRLMEDTHRQLAESGYCGTVLVPGNPGLAGMYKKFGYRPFCSVEAETAPVEKLPVATEISPAEYAHLRKSFLDENAVFQDNTALEYLAAYGGFCKTPEGIYCGYQEGNTFHFEEVLGQVFPSQAEHLQAMYCSLDGDSQLPDYFAIPLL